MRTFVLLLLVLLACSDRFEISDDDPIAVYEAAIGFTELRPDDFENVVIDGKFLDLNDPYRVEPGDMAVLRELAERFPVARVCDPDCAVQYPDETYVMVSALKRPARDVAEVHVLRYVDEDTGDAFKMRLEKRDGRWEVIHHVITFYD